jgi:hypothetical protein
VRAAGGQETEGPHEYAIRLVGQRDYWRTSVVEAVVLGRLPPARKRLSVGPAASVAGAVRVCLMLGKLVLRPLDPTRRYVASVP